MNERLADGTDVLTASTAGRLLALVNSVVHRAHSSGIADERHGPLSSEAHEAQRAARAALSALVDAVGAVTLPDVYRRPSEPHTGGS